MNKQELIAKKVEAEMNKNITPEKRALKVWIKAKLLGNKSTAYVLSGVERQILAHNMRNLNPQEVARILDGNPDTPTLAKLTLSDIYFSKPEPKVFGIIQDPTVSPKRLCDYFCMTSFHNKSSLVVEPRQDYGELYKGIFSYLNNTNSNENMLEAAIQSYLSLNVPLTDYIRAQKVYAMIAPGGLENLFLLDAVREYEANPRAIHDYQLIISKASEINPQRDYAKELKSAFEQVSINALVEEDSFIKSTKELLSNE